MIYINYVNAQKFLRLFIKKILYKQKYIYILYKQIYKFYTKKYEIFFFIKILCSWFNWAKSIKKMFLKTFY